MFKKSILNLIAAASLLAVNAASYAAVVDLSVDTSGTVTAALGGLTKFEQYNAPPTGTGVFDPFLRIQGNGIEAGYNTDGAIEFETKQGQTGGKNWTHSIKLGDFAVIDGKIELLLDINQSDGHDNKYLSLDVMKIFLADSPNLTGYNQAAETGLGTKIYDLGDNWVKMDNTTFKSGSGTGDMKVTIIKDASWDNGKYLYLYTEFGHRFGANDGFEEWSAKVPEPATIALLGLGSLVLLRKRLA